MQYLGHLNTEKNKKLDITIHIVLTVQKKQCDSKNKLRTVIVMLRF